MIKNELESVIKNFEEALRKKEMPTFDGNLHRVEQVLRILKVDLHNFWENEDKRSGIYRRLWETND
jgi:hypothetical protein